MTEALSVLGDLSLKNNTLHQWINSQNSLKRIDLQVVKVDKNPLKFPVFKGERFIVLLQGSIEIHLSCGTTFELKNRFNVFDSRPSGFYLPGNTEATIFSPQTSEIAVCISRISSPSSIHKPYLIHPKDTLTRTVGCGKYKRKVTDILSIQTPAHFLLIGETLSLPGMWSSYPPHKHDKFSSSETKMEEIYFYKLQNPKRFGLQCLYSPDHHTDECYRVFNNSAMAIPYGYHPVSAPPDSSLYYLWILSGPKRNLIYAQDPSYAS